MRTVFGNSGSTEHPLLAEFFDDFDYVLGLRESVVVGRADDHAQGKSGAALVTLHAAPGLGNAIGAVVTATTTEPLSLSWPANKIGANSPRSRSCSGNS